MNPQNKSKTTGFSESDGESREEFLRQQLQAFNLSGEISRVISSAPDTESLLSRMVLGLNEVLHYKKIVIFGLDADNFTLRVEKTLGLEPHELDDLSFALGFMDGDYGDALFRNRHIIVEEVPDYDTFSRLAVKKYVVFPINPRIYKELNEQPKCQAGIKARTPANPWCWLADSAEYGPQGMTEDEKRHLCLTCPAFSPLGMLWIDLTDRDDIISADEVAMITSIADQAALVLENFRIQEKLKLINTELEAAQSIIDADLRKANRIQNKLIPETFPVASTRVGAFYRPASKIGGDYYDFFRISPDHLGIVIADVSGHGITAAMIMSMFKMLLKTECSGKKKPSPAAILERINSVFLSEVDSENFVTVFFGIFNEKNRELHWCNAGHENMLLADLTTGDCELLGSGGLFLGVLEEFRAKEEVTIIAENQRLLLFTDGITETPKDGEGIPFGFDRLKLEFVKTLGRSPQGSATRIMTELSLFHGDGPFPDDLSLLCVDL